MLNKSNHNITVFEHEALYTYKGVIRLSDDQLLALQNFYGAKGTPYFSLVHNGIKFCEYVGALQIGGTTIEVLPKADRNNNTDSWRSVLIGMLKASGVFKIHAPSNANLKIKSNSILDLYFQWFITETEQLLHKGLVKRYRKTEGNSMALKGALQFGKNIQYNLTHKERFYVKYTTYDREHPLNCVLYKTIQLLKHINTNTFLKSRIGNLLLNFPELPDIKVSETFFQQILYNRKTEGYKKAIDIARLLLLNYHPDVSTGKNDVLALMFDMNLLWEQFVFVSLHKLKPEGITIIAQSPKDFWKPESGNKQRMIPDIVINKNKPGCIVLDTKWKNLNGYNPSPEDLRQLYVYSKFHNNAKAALVFPGELTSYTKGTFFDELTGFETEMECGIFIINVDTNIKLWQQQIAEALFSSIAEANFE